MKEKFVFIDIEFDQLPVLVRVKSHIGQDLHFSFLKGKNGVYARKVDREFRENKDQYLGDDNFCKNSS